MNIAFLGMAAALGLSAAGSAFGTGFAGMSSVGAWKKCRACSRILPSHEWIHYLSVSPAIPVRVYWQLRHRMYWMVLNNCRILL